MNTKRYEWMLEDSEPCDCDRCKEMCKRPCWGLPHEIEAIMEAGFGHMLMHDCWYTQTERQIDVISPAADGYAGQDAPWLGSSECLFLDENEHCTLHDLGLKPYEGRVCRHDFDTPSDLRINIRKAWKASEGVRVSKLYFNDIVRKKIVLTVGGTHGHKQNF